MIIVYSKNGIPVRITEERWEHITRRHPEIRNQKEKVMETISTPDIILGGDFSELLAIRFYPKTPLTEKYLVVVYREISSQDGFILTAYFTNTPSKRREVIWKP
jgi:hypothetical protein